MKEFTSRDPRTGEIVYVTAKRKNSELLIALMQKSAKSIQEQRGSPDTR